MVRSCTISEKSDINVVVFYAVGFLASQWHDEFRGSQDSCIDRNSSAAAASEGSAVWGELLVFLHL